jgi:hypothetical protein
MLDADLAPVSKSLFGPSVNVPVRDKAVCVPPAEIPYSRPRAVPDAKFGRRPSPDHRERTIPRVVGRLRHPTMAPRQPARQPPRTSSSMQWSTGSRSRGSPRASRPAAVTSNSSPSEGDTTMSTPQAVPSYTPNGILAATGDATPKLPTLHRPLWSVAASSTVPAW